MKYKNFISRSNNVTILSKTTIGEERRCYTILSKTTIGEERRCYGRKV